MGLFDVFSNIFGGSNPANAANPYINRIPGQLHDIYDPYLNRGNDQYAALNSRYSAMGNDPSAYLNKMMSNYEPSKAYQLQRDEATRAAGNTAAAGGMRGSLQDITKQSRLTDTLMGQDMQNWLGNVMGIQNQGTQGQQGFYNQGFNASRELAGDLSNAFGTQGQLAFQGQANQNQSMSDILSALIGAGGMAAGGYLGRK